MKAAVWTIRAGGKRAPGRPRPLTFPGDPPCIGLRMGEPGSCLTCRGGSCAARSCSAGGPTALKAAPLPWTPLSAASPLPVLPHAPDLASALLTKWKPPRDSGFAATAHLLGRRSGTRICPALPPVPAPPPPPLTYGGVRAGPSGRAHVLRQSLCPGWFHTHRNFSHLKSKPTVTPHSLHVSFASRYRETSGKSCLHTFVSSSSPSVPFGLGFAPTPPTPARLALSLPTTSPGVPWLVRPARPLRALRVPCAWTHAIFACLLPVFPLGRQLSEAGPWLCPAGLSVLRRLLATRAR